MKRISLVIAALALCTFTMAQSVADGRKMLRYGRLQSATTIFEKLVQANPGDVEASYWLGQLLINDGKLDEARELYAKALAANANNPLLIVASGHIDLMEQKKDAAKQKFEQAIAATKNRKNKNYGDPAILAAIGRANSTGDSKTGDPDYGLEKLKQAAELDGKDPDVFVDMGLIHLKRGPEYGGAAKRAFEDAIDRDPAYGKPYYRIGKIFESQRNTELFLDYYNRAVQNDPNFAPAYLSLYDYYKEKDVNKAKSYLDKFMANNDPDLETDIFYADFIFRSGKYAEALEKLKELEGKLRPGEKFPKLFKLYSVVYDRLGDSTKALNYMEQYVGTQSAENLKGDDYADLATLYLRFPGMASKADALVEKAVGLDTVVANKIDYMKALADAYAKQGDPKGNYKWLKRIDDINPKRTAVTYFYLADAAYQAGDYQASMEVANRYADAYPDQIQGYSLLRRAAVTADADTSTGVAIPAINKYIQFLMKDVATYKGRILESQSYKLYYFAKIRDFESALEAVNGILEVDPTNAYGIDAKAEVERQLKATGGSKTPNASKVDGAGKPGGNGSGPGK